MLNKMQEILTRENELNAVALERLASQLHTVNEAMHDVQQNDAEEREELETRVADREYLESVLAAVQSDNHGELPSVTAPISTHG